MPTYEYECRKCKHRFEAFQRISAEPLKECPECKGKLRRLLGTGAGIIFKGSGFYSTDYRSSSYESDKKKAEGTSGKKETKKETSEKKKGTNGPAKKAPEKN